MSQTIFVKWEIPKLFYYICYYVKWQQFNFESHIINRFISTIQRYINCIFIYFHSSPHAAQMDHLLCSDIIHCWFTHRYWYYSRWCCLLRRMLTFLIIIQILLYCKQLSCMLYSHISIALLYCYKCSTL